MYIVQTAIMDSSESQGTMMSWILPKNFPWRDIPLPEVRSGVKESNSYSHEQGKGHKNWISGIQVFSGIYRCKVHTKGLTKIILSYSKTPGWRSISFPGTPQSVGHTRTTAGRRRCVQAWGLSRSCFPFSFSVSLSIFPGTEIQVDKVGIGQVNTRKTWSLTINDWI